MSHYDVKISFIPSYLLNMLQRYIYGNSFYTPTAFKIAKSENIAYCFGLYICLYVSVSLYPQTLTLSVPFDVYKVTEFLLGMHILWFKSIQMTSVLIILYD